MTVDRSLDHPPTTAAVGPVSTRWITLMLVLAAGLAQGIAFAAGLVDVVAATKPSVVAVGTFNPTSNPRFGFRGTGFVVGNGLQVITNRHVLTGAEDVGSNNRLVVAVPRGADQLPEVRAATVANTDLEHDLALLQIDGAPLPPLAMPSGELPHEGQEVALIGFPLGAGLGLAPVTHRGIVAAVTAIALPAPTSRQLNERTVMRLRQGPFQILQLDATAYPGNSGSPLVDANSGALVGVINLVLIKGTRESAIASPTGITYAVPAVHVRELVQSTGR
jgi:serine protease Do